MRSLFLSFAIAFPLVGAVTIAACSSSNNSNNSSSTTACTSNSDCSGGQQCGYSIGKGCSAPGTCTTPSGGLPYLACGCQGQGVSYIAPGFTTAPVTSGEACQTDAGPTTEDSGTDAATDAPTEASTTSEAGADAGVDGSGDLDGSSDASDANTD
jgi:hypothetical protein